jgi:predicted Zn-dependent protease
MWRLQQRVSNGRVVSRAWVSDRYGILIAIMTTRLCIVTIALLFLLGVGAAVAGESAPPAAPAASQAEQAPAPQMTPEDKADAEIGKSAAESVEKQFKVVKDSADLPRINAIMERLKPGTQKPYQTYTVKVLDNKAINAFSLPGGYLFFTQGLLDAVESDDELAAVAAHEMAHVSLSHSRKMMGRSDRYSKILGPLVLASILSRSDRVDPGAMLMVGSLVVEDALNHYGREAELEADHEAVLYLKNSGSYNPVAMLTVAEGLAHMENAGLQVDPGVFQTHPFPAERVAAITTELRELSIPIERRRVTKSLYSAAGAAKIGDREVGELTLTAGGGAKPWTAVVSHPAATVDGASPIARAQEASRKLNALLLADLTSIEVNLVTSANGVTVQARHQALFTITPDDAALLKTTVDALARQAIQAMRTGFQQERVGRAY